MPNYKNIFVVDREEEKRLYQIMNDIHKHNECIIEDASSSEWHSALRTLGRRGESLFNNDMLEVWKTDPHKRRNSRLIRPKKDVSVVEIPGNKRSRFHFKRRRFI